MGALPQPTLPAPSLTCKNGRCTVITVPNKQPWRKAVGYWICQPKTVVWFVLSLIVSRRRSNIRLQRWWTMATNSRDGFVPRAESSQTKGTTKMKMLAKMSSITIAKLIIVIPESQYINEAVPCTVILDEFGGSGRSTAWPFFLPCPLAGYPWKPHSGGQAQNPPFAWVEGCFSPG